MCHQRKSWWRNHLHEWYLGLVPYSRLKGAGQWLTPGVHPHSSDGVSEEVSWMETPWFFGRGRKRSSLVLQQSPWICLWVLNLVMDHVKGSGLIKLDDDDGLPSSSDWLEKIIEDSRQSYIYTMMLSKGWVPGWKKILYGQVGHYLLAGVSMTLPRNGILDIGQKFLRTSGSRFELFSCSIIIADFSDVEKGPTQDTELSF